MNPQQVRGKNYEGSLAENYQRFFVPAIGEPLAHDLIACADLQPGEGVLDVACGTGVVARLAAERVGTGGTVTGLDINPGMLAVARSTGPLELSIHWQEATAGAMPFPDGAFAVVLCQMGLQFFPSRLSGLREMLRVLRAGGRALISVPGPKPPLFAILANALSRHLGPQAAAFVELVFSLHEAEELEKLMRSAGFQNVEVEARSSSLHLPAPADFLWQYIYSTPLAEAAAQAGEARRAALGDEVCERWQAFVEEGCLALQVGMTIARGLK